MAVFAGFLRLSVKKTKNKRLDTFSIKMTHQNGFLLPRFHIWTGGKAGVNYQIVWRQLLIDLTEKAN